MLYKIKKLDNLRTRKKAAKIKYDLERPERKERERKEREQKRIKLKEEKEKEKKIRLEAWKKQQDVWRKKREKHEKRMNNKNPTNRRFGIGNTEINRQRVLKGMKGVVKTIDVAKALQLRVTKQMTYADIGKYFNCSTSTVANKLKPFLNMLADPADLQAYNAQKSHLLDAVELKLLNTVVDEEKMQKATLHQAASALNIVSGIGRLEKGLSTENVAFQDLSESLEKLQQRKAQLAETLGLKNDEEKAEEE